MSRLGVNGGARLEWKGFARAVASRDGRLLALRRQHLGQDRRDPAVDPGEGAPVLVQDGRVPEPRPPGRPLCAAEHVQVRQADLSLLGASLAFSAVKFEPRGFDNAGEGLVLLGRIILLVLLVRPRWLARLAGWRTPPQRREPLGLAARHAARAHELQSPRGLPIFGAETAESEDPELAKLPAGGFLRQTARHRSSRYLMLQQ